MRARGYSVRRALVGGVLGVTGLMVAPAPEAAAQFVNFPCQVADVTVFSAVDTAPPRPLRRFHIRCVPGTPENIGFFAYSLNELDVDRLLSVATTAVATHRTLSILYEKNDVSGAAFGCLAADCRRILTLGLLDR
jgi:hypothetical protein